MGSTLLINPNTFNLPMFRAFRDTEIVTAIYGRVPVLVDESNDEQGNLWGYQGQLMFTMNTDSTLFRTREQLDAEGWELQGNSFRLSEGDECLPILQSKLASTFNHRALSRGFLHQNDSGYMREPIVQALKFLMIRQLPLSQGTGFQLMNFGRGLKLDAIGF